MFWRVQGEEQASPLEKILDKDSFTLEELLLEEDIIQEVKAMNDRLVDYLKQPETVWELSKYVVEPFEAVKKLEKELHKKNERELLEATNNSEDQDDLFPTSTAEGGEAGNEEASGTTTTEEIGQEGDEEKEDEVEEDKSESAAASSAVEAGQEVTPPKKMTEDELRHYAFQSAQRVCEIFCCEVDEIFTTLVSSVSTDSDDSEELASGQEQKQGEEEGEGYDYLGYLFSFLNQTKPLDSVLVGYYSRLLVSIAQRRPTEISTYIQANPDILFKLMDHLYSYSITEFVLRLISGDEQNALYQREQGNEWLVKTDLLKLLVEKATSATTQSRGGEEERLLFNTVANAVSCVVGIANTAPSAIASQLQDPEIIARLLSTIDKETPPHVLIAAIDVFIAILQPRQAKQAMSPDVMMSYGAFGSPVAAEETIDASMIDCAGLIMEKVNDLCGMLKANDEEQSFDTSYGKVSARLGMRRYKILDLIGKVVNIVDADKCLRITEKTQVIQTSFALMYEMPFNSMLHNVVQNIVFGLLCTENKEVILSLIDNCKLHSLISSAQPTIGNGDSSKMGLLKPDKPLRSGYFGVVTSIANQILQCATTDIEIEKKLEDDLQWTSWVVDVLVVQNKLEDPTSWECGRPSRVNDILGDMGGSSAVDLSLYSGFSMGASSNDNDRYDNDNDNYDFDLEDDEEDEDVYDTVDVVSSFQGLSTGGDESGVELHQHASLLDQQTLEDNVVLVSSPDDLDNEGSGAEADMKLIEEKQKIKRADTPAITTGGSAAAGGSDAKFNSANFWRSSYTFDITDEES
jgi:hypothetical protein